jgi:carotenoid cleavage dioxygenase-like enzyme
MTMPDTTPFAYAAGFRSLTEETPSPVSLAVQGKMPHWLEGALLRTGPAKFEVGARTYNHWFDGLAMLHRFAFARGAVTYANRFLESDAYRAAQATGKIAYAEFATDPCRTLFGRVAAIFDPKLTDNANVNIVALGGAAAAFTETTMPLRFQPDTLKTLGVFGYEPPLSGQVSTAHPHYDAGRKRQYNYMVEFGLRSRYRLFSVCDSGSQDEIAEIPVDRPAYMHSFAMTERYLALVEFPLTISALDLKFSGKPFIRNYRWQPERGLRFHVVEKDGGGEVATAVGDALFAFHHVNAYEERDRLVIDMIAYPDPDIIDQLYLARLRAGTPLTATGRLTRFELTPGGAIARRELSPVAIELPRINYRSCAGKPYRYVWGTGIEVEGDFLDSIVKVDLAAATTARWYERGCYPGEPVFVAAPKAQAEDDGILLSIVLDAGKNRSFLLVLDAATLKEVARAETPHAIPFHFHGNYFPGRSLPA